jgi:hypothetical protein
MVAGIGFIFMDWLLHESRTRNCAAQPVSLPKTRNPFTRSRSTYSWISDG